VGLEILNGASLSKMLLDKIYAISGEQVCRRMKGVKNKPDFIDVYTRVSNLVDSLALQRETLISDKEKSR
jgi:hypothetical protein